jgi:sortase A
MKKHTITIFVSILMLSAIIFFMGVFVHAAVYAPDDEITPSPALVAIDKKQENLTGHGAQLSIPKIGVTAHIQNVGITKKGNIGTPNNFTDVGWYKYGPLPGDAGTAIIDGHVDNGFALPGVFKHLSDLKLGDDVYVTTHEGKILHFVVTNIATYDYDAPTNEIFTQSKNPTLLLITCAGTWVDEIGTHNKRLVVTTGLVS